MLMKQVDCHFESSRINKIHHEVAHTIGYSGTFHIPDKQNQLYHIVYIILPILIYVSH